MADPTRELTLRALVAGCLIGVVLAVGNLYLGLKTGWVDAGMITAAIVGWRVFFLGARENVVSMTAAASAAMMASTVGLVGAMPAMQMLGYALPSGWLLAAWGVALAVVGTFVGAALRARLIVVEPLPFPSGTAAAEVIEALHGDAARKGSGRALSLVAATVSSLALTWFRDGRPAFVPALVALPARLAGATGAALGLGVAVSPMMLGVGLLVGLRIAASVALGAALAWIGLAPRLVAAHIVDGARFDALIPWLTWPGVAVGLAAAMLSLAIGWRVLARGLRDVVAVGRGGAGALALAATALAVVAVGRVAFGLPAHLTVLALAVSVALSCVCARAAGETDINPVGQMGQVTQVLVGPLARGAMADLALGSVPAGDAAHAGMMLWSFKTGARLGADPRRQIIAQLVGTLAGAAAVVPAYRLLLGSAQLGSKALPAPSVLTWKAVAEVVAHGASGLPAHAGLAVAIAVAAGIALALAERGKGARFVPSPVAMGIGFLVPPSYAAAILVGGVVAWALARRWPAWSERNLAALGSGGIVGEALAGLVAAALTAGGVI